jgi:Zn-dependent peptidase ImmA (M78 family)
MTDKNNRYSEIDEILSGILKEATLRELFEKRLHELDLTQTAARKLLGLQRRTINGILDGTQKRANYAGFQKVATFLNLTIEEVMERHSSLVEKNFENENTPANKKKFIRENFDLIVLKKAGFIDSLTDLNKIEEKIISFFGFSSIFEYKKRAFDTAFSSGMVSQKNLLRNSITRDFWLTSAKNFAVKLDNPYSYDRQGLVKFFPQIRWHSTNVELGLINVIKVLFKIGITVIFQPSLSSLHLRGATFSVNNKPCIVLTDYKGFYPTLWHCLIHELYHVLFDWEEIKNNSFHLSEDGSELFTIDEREMEADDFARRYLFSDEKMEEVKPFIYDQRYINEVAKENNVHPSIIHIYYAFDNDKTDRMVWARARRFMPDIKKCVYHLENPWDNPKPIEEVAKRKKLEIYN